MTEEPGYQILDRFYPVPAGYKFGDPVLIEKATGITWMEYVDRINDLGDQGDPIVTLAQLVVAVKRGNPTWSRHQVIQYVETLDEDDVTFVAPEVVDAGPPVSAPPAESQEAAETTTSVTPAISDPSPPTSKSGSVSLSDNSSQKQPGIPV